MSKKPFFYRVDAADFMAQMMSIRLDSDRGKFVKQLSIDLVTGTGSNSYSQKLISEATEYINKKKIAGMKGGKQKASSAKAVLKHNSSTTHSKSVASNNSSKDLKPSLSDFQIFWDAFAYKEGRGGAEKSWSQISNYSPELLEKIIQAAKKEAIRRVDIIKRGTTPKMAQGWITERRWEDEQLNLSVPTKRIISPVTGMWEEVPIDN